ncbi:hypothetical protein pEaSNUABM37_00107 [Erwinia phage pEa_SNUABM_37]|nr:hypothetical protein pEaSNUABM37_00107 [Erwinia phage pEa_SNUABM_37]QXO10577.1 hypothetical protein pEaSNUABM48_00107 [Erwinia phage pEa_SNUABM_48]
MHIHLKWVNANTQQTVTNIYRGTTTLDRNNLGTPLVVLSAGETEYYDRTVEAGTTYYYVIEYVSATTRVKSRVYSFLADYVRGAGGNVVLFGNDDFGFMGYGTFPSYTEILTKIGVGRETASPTTDAAVNGCKFSVAGKVYYSVFLSGSALDFTTTLAFLKRTDKLPITIEGINYLAYPLDMLGDGFVWDGTYSSTAPVGKRDMFEYLVIPQLPSVTIDGSWKGDVLGRVSTQGTNSPMSKAVAGMARIPYWNMTNNTIAYAASAVSSQLLHIVLELVEA